MKRLETTCEMLAALTKGRRTAADLAESRRFYASPAPCIADYERNTNWKSGRPSDCRVPVFELQSSPFALADYRGPR